MVVDIAARRFPAVAGGELDEHAHQKNVRATHLSLLSREAFFFVFFYLIKFSLFSSCSFDWADEQKDIHCPTSRSVRYIIARTGRRIRSLSMNNRCVTFATTSLSVYSFRTLAIVTIENLWTLEARERVITSVRARARCIARYGLVYRIYLITR